MGTDGKTRRDRSCPQAEDLSAFLDGELDAAARARWAAHLARCPACAGTLRLFGAADAAVESAAAAAELSPELRERLEAIPYAAAARHRRTLAWVAAAATIAVAAILAFRSEPGPALRIERGDVVRDERRVSATSDALFTARAGFTLALEKGAVVDVDEASGSLLLVAGRARCVAERGETALLRTPAGDVRTGGGACEVSVETLPARPGSPTTTCRVLVESSGGATEWLTPSGERSPLRGGEALFREIDLRAFGPSPSTAVAAASRTFELYVYDEDGAPLADASVRLVAASGAEAARAVTTEKGRAEIGGVPLGDYRIRVEKPGVGDKEFGIAIEAGESTPRSVFLGSRG